MLTSPYLTVRSLERKIYFSHCYVSTQRPSLLPYTVPNVLGVN